VPSFLTPLVDKVLAERKKAGPETLLFPAASGNNLRNDVFAKALNRAKKLSGLSDKDISHHSLRHYGGTQFGATGASLADVKEYLGHSSTAAAIRYLHPTGRGVQLVESMPVPDSIELLTGAESEDG
jgi:site-specific recombinase XerD